MWRALVSIVGWMFLSGGVLIGGFLAYHRDAFQAEAEQPEVWAGKRLHLIAGRGARAGEALRVHALSSQAQAVISSGSVMLNADRYPLLEYTLRGLRSEMNPVFFWRRAAAPETLFSLPLEANPRGLGQVRLARHEAWRGTVIEFGIGFHRQLPAPVVLERLIFKPLSPATLLGAVWFEWTTFEGWNQRSINFVEGGGRDALLPPLPAVAAWVGLALLLSLGWALWRRRPWDWRAGAGMLLLGWMVLDLRWQAGLWQQLQETYERYGGKDWRAKHLAAEDGPLFAFITAVKGQLPPPPQRVFLVTAASLEADPYTRQRARYHLLPYNVHSDGSYPPDPAHVRPGDYVLILGSSPELAFHPERQLLRWGRGHERRLAVEEVYTESLGTLYRVRKGP